ncbi:MAG: radical SAM protein [Burkholderiales bacterium]|nr:radical SAM protein [Burkholderiales bacterium]
MQAGGGAVSGANDLYLLAVNLTRRCNLGCAHCYLDAATLRDGDADELGTAELRALLDDLAARSPQTMVVLTGGEPLLRADLEDLVAHGRSRGLAMVVGTNGLGLSDRRVSSLVAAGAMGVGISVDSLDPGRHDRFRGLPGAWARTMDGIEACKRHGLPFQIHFSVTQANADEVPSMIDFARAAGARVLNVFFLVCTGRGESMSDIAPETYERVLGELVAAQATSRDLLIRARCAPHFKRVAYQRDQASSLTRAAGYEGGGCLAGIHYARIAPDGGVTACPYIPEPQGNIRDAGFWTIWDHAPQFQALRAPALHGKCGACEFRLLCGGCRARPLALGGGLMDTDPWCVHAPDGSAVIEPLRDQPGAVAWSEAAQARLERVPPFLRKMVRKRAEDHVRGLGEDLVTPEHLATLSARRFGAEPPGPRAPQPSLPWSEQARDRLAAMPAFLQPGVRAVAEDVARAEGRLEVNVKLLDRLQAEEAPGRSLPWTAGADALIAAFVATKPPQARAFVAPALEGAAEQAARKRRTGRVDEAEAQAAIAQLSGGVEWDEDALARVLAAPDFNRAGIKKAAEFNARREGLTRITSGDLTRYRNRAMMRAVQRMKSFGMRELSFDAYGIARERVPRLKDNPEADQRFATIRRFVAAREHPGELLGKDLLDRMKAELRDNPRAPTRPDGAGAGIAVDGED